MVGFMIVLLWYYIVYFFMGSKKTKIAPHSDIKTKFAIIIAARNESKVIRGIFDSLKKQTYDKNYFDTWIIVESKDDPSIQIAEEYGYKWFVRDRLTPARKTKGFAIQELIEYFDRTNLQYDSYMIFDADNLLDPDYIEKLNDLRQTGVKVGLGYRNFTNANTNWLTACSATMFAYMNQVTNKGRSHLFHKTTIMGTGYFVDSDVIKDAGGWIFVGMTEDIQLTAYCYYHDVNMRYYPVTCFYDEQSPYFKDVHNQHVRWLAGYFSSRKYLKRCGIEYPYHTRKKMNLMRFEFRFSVFPFIIYNLIDFLLLICSLCLAIASTVFEKNYTIAIRSFGLTLYQFLVLYLPFVIASSYVMITDRKHLKYTKGTRIWCALTFFFFFYDFVGAFLSMVFSKKKRTTWKKIEHTGEVDKK